MEIIHVVGVRTNFDLRGIHKSRSKFGQKCKHNNEVFLLVNRARTSFRLIDSRRNVHTFYLDRGEVLDTARIQRHVTAFGGMTIAFRTYRGPLKRHFDKIAA